MDEKNMCECIEQLPNGALINFGQYLVKEDDGKIVLRCCKCDKIAESSANFHRRKLEEKRKLLQEERERLEKENDTNA